MVKIVNCMKSLSVSIRYALHDELKITLRMMWHFDFSFCPDTDVNFLLKSSKKEIFIKCEAFVLCADI